MSSSAPGPSICENCACEEDDLTSVWPGGDDTADSPQLWCPECVALHPNEPAADAEEAAD